MPHRGHQKQCRASQRYCSLCGDAGLWNRPPTSDLQGLNPELLDRSLGIAAAPAIAITATDPGASVPPWTLQRNPRRCVVDTDGYDDRPVRRFDILHINLRLPEPKGGHNSHQPTRRTSRRTAPAPGLPDRALDCSSARSRPRAGTVANGRPLKVLASPPDVRGGQGLAASAPSIQGLNPELLDRSLGIAAAPAIAITATDPGASTPPWTLQRNPRRCVVDTDGPANCLASRPALQVVPFGPYIVPPATLAEGHAWNATTAT